MATGFLQVMVTTQTALPLENVKITVIDSASGKTLEDKTVYTDDSGKTPLIELETIDRQYTLDEDTKEKGEFDKLYREYSAKYKIVKKEA